MISMNRERGVTLVEMLIVMVIIAVLAAVALPSYWGQMQKSRRSEAKSVLTQVSSMMQQFRTEQNTFTADLTTLGFPNAGWNDTENAYYEFSVVAPTAGCPIASCFVLQVRPKAGSPQADDPWSYQLLSDGRRQRNDGGGWINDWKK